MGKSKHHNRKRTHSAEAKAAVVQVESTDPIPAATTSQISQQDDIPAPQADVASKDVAEKEKEARWKEAEEFAAKVMEEDSVKNENDDTQPEKIFIAKSQVVNDDDAGIIEARRLNEERMLKKKAEQDTENEQKRVESELRSLVSSKAATTNNNNNDNSSSINSKSSSEKTSEEISKLLGGIQTTQESWEVKVEQAEKIEVEETKKAAKIAEMLGVPTQPTQESWEIKAEKEEEETAQSTVTVGSELGWGNWFKRNSIVTTVAAVVVVVGIVIIRRRK
jgi:hypothetical protein